MPESIFSLPIELPASKQWTEGELNPSQIGCQPFSPPWNMSARLETWTEYPKVCLRDFAVRWDSNPHVPTLAAQAQDSKPVSHYGNIQQVGQRGVEPRQLLLPKQAAYHQALCPLSSVNTMWLFSLFLSLSLSLSSPSLALCQARWRPRIATA